jgi:hypothetical protein
MIKFVNVKDPQHKVVKRAEVPSESNPFIHYFVFKTAKGKYTCNCISFKMNRNKGCKHIQIALGKRKLQLAGAK